MKTIIKTNDPKNYYQDKHIFFITVLILESTFQYSNIKMQSLHLIWQGVWKRWMCFHNYEKRKKVPLISKIVSEHKKTIWSKSDHSWLQVLRSPIIQVREECYPTSTKGVIQVITRNYRRCLITSQSQNSILWNSPVSCIIHTLSHHNQIQRAPMSGGPLTDPWDAADLVSPPFLACFLSFLFLSKWPIWLLENSQKNLNN